MIVHVMMAISYWLYSRMFLWSLATLCFSLLAHPGRISCEWHVQLDLLVFSYTDSQLVSYIAEWYYIIMILGCMARRLERRLKHCTLYGGDSGYSLRLVLALHPTTVASGYRKEQLSLWIVSLLVFQCDTSKLTENAQFYANTARTCDWLGLVCTSCTVDCVRREREEPCTSYIPHFF